MTAAFDEKFYRLLGTWLHADDAEIATRDGLIEQARAFAHALARDLATREAFDNTSSELARIASAPEWDGDFLTQAINWTNVDWTFDEDSLEDLRAAVRAVVEELGRIRDRRSFDA